MSTRCQASIVLCAVCLAAGFVAVAAPLARKTSSFDRKAALETFFRDNVEVRYQYGACSSSQMDCSCFVQRLFTDKFALPLPRSTLAQASTLQRYKVASIARSTELDDSRLCVGDLIYTYRGPSWSEGPRHVVVYTGDDWVLHSSANLGGIGSSNLAWVRQYRLQGVYRPLGCERSPERRPPVRTSPAPETTITEADAETASVRAVIDTLFRAWEARDPEIYQRLWSADAVQWRHGRKLGYRELMAKRREEFRELQQVSQSHRFEAVSVWGDCALIEVVYDLDLTYRDRKPHHERGEQESYVLQRQDGTWRITHNETYPGE